MSKHVHRHLHSAVYSICNVIQEYTVSVFFLGPPPPISTSWVFFLTTEHDVTLLQRIKTTKQKQSQPSWHYKQKQNNSASKREHLNKPEPGLAQTRECSRVVRALTFVVVHVEVIRSRENGY